MGLLAAALLAGGCGEGAGDRAHHAALRPPGPPAARPPGPTAAGSGAVSAALARPLHVPRLAAGASCPASPADARTFMGRVAGPGPIYITGFDAHSPLPVVRSPRSVWARQQVVVLAAARYQGPVLIRGRQVNGPHAVGFGGSRRPDDRLELRAPGVSTIDEPVGWRAWLALIRVRAGGCYAYQIDGSNFSSVIVFEARLR